MLYNNPSTGSEEWSICEKSQCSKNVSPEVNDECPTNNQSTQPFNECVEKNNDLKIIEECNETIKI